MRNRRLWLFAELVATAGIAFVCVGFARYLLATVFQEYDDEGYMLLSLRSVMDHHPLYSETYSQSGPFHFLAQSFQFRLLNLPVDHDSGRLVAFLDWMLAGVAGAACVLRLYRNVLLAAASGAGVVVLGAVVANEPGHPNQVVLPFFMLAALLSTWVTAGASSGLVLAALASIGSALVFTKINLGVFYSLALVQTCAVLWPAGRLRSAALGLLGTGAAALPLALMHAHLDLFSGPGDAAVRPGRARAPLARDVGDRTALRWVPGLLSGVRLLPPRGTGGGRRPPATPPPPGLRATGEQARGPTADPRGGPHHRLRLRTVQYRLRAARHRVLRRRHPPRPLAPDPERPGRAPGPDEIAQRRTQLAARVEAMPPWTPPAAWNEDLVREVLESEPTCPADEIRCTSSLCVAISTDPDCDRSSWLAATSSAGGVDVTRFTWSDEVDGFAASAVALVPAASKGDREVQERVNAMARLLLLDALYP